VAAATGYQGEIRWDASKPDGTLKKQLDVSRIKALGWQACIHLPDGLSSTVALFRQQLAQQLVRL
jgi:GDP-L-fucose synthase